MGFGRLRHAVGGRRSRRPSWRIHRRLGGLRGLRLGTGLPLFLQLLQVRDGGSEGTLEMHAFFVDELQPPEVFLVVFI